VAFGTRRPTRTPTRSDPRWKSRLLRAGLEPPVARVLLAAGSRPTQGPYVRSRDPAPKARLCRGLGRRRGPVPGQRGNPWPGRWPGPS
jgi:hypothetical protein